MERPKRTIIRLRQWQEQEGLFFQVVLAFLCWISLERFCEKGGPKITTAGVIKVMDAHRAALDDEKTRRRWLQGNVG